MAERISTLLRRSLGHLASDVPASYRIILDRIGPLVVDIDVDGERFSLSGGQSLAVTDGPPTSAGARIVTSRSTILDVLDAAVGLREAVDSGAVTVQGALDDVIRAHDTLLAYVHAAVRAPSQPALMTELREAS